MPRSKFVFAILLALSFFYGAQATFFGRKFIGYARVSESLAERINDKNKLIVEGSGGSIGPGFYLVNDPAGWISEGSWYCAVKASKRKIKKMDKVYIPKSHLTKISETQVERQNLWGEDETLIEKYITGRHLGGKSYIKDPKKTLRFSWVKNTNEQWQLQMAIPKKVLEESHLGLWAKCFQSEEELKKYSDRVIPWEKWTKGKRFPPPPEDWRSMNTHLITN
ncbi:hypothetical protein MBM_00459 [Drepanopeziza brunnea f. sp. 'multigermtubi' MB_m1]|uniref:Uncharacterized protein n=1 Tax=Marssonina brunnea f. sp. multigermtubi (strain MB_m1) TaxID=1072389 RepID=K1X8E5_MARBU|nr:uncharacterized protein MBM_00459 [Drepanopeziza brunnea f. sp. 'multigermtubi' MB_m1]EKD21346.1 hypothetical protein MBM_00459 [Drepanopeziza brunnea f. sp. 'multigermtubi' MB_m1]